MIRFEDYRLKEWITLKATGRRSAKHGGYPTAALLGGPVDRRVGNIVSIVDQLSQYDRLAYRRE